MGAPLAEEEKVRIRHHLGYPNVEAASTFYLGVPAAMQTTFMIEGAMNKILPAAVGKARELLCRLDAIENQVFCGSDLADVNKIGEIEVNQERVRTLADYYVLAAQGLANLLAVVDNPFDLRTWTAKGKGGINVPVVG